MKKPNELDPIASKFWARHAKRLQDNGLLTDATLDSFVLLCRTYSVLAQHDPHNDADKMAIIKFVALNKVYQTLARGFGMNSDKPKHTEDKEDKDEFGL